MTKREIFKDIVSIMEKDSATYKDKGIGNVEKYQDRIREEMREEEFYSVVSLYLTSFGVPGHLSFSKNTSDSTILGFTVRRYQDELYVTFAEEGLTVKKGDRIIRLGRLTLTEAEEKYGELLYGEKGERQSWGMIIRHFEMMTIQNDDGTEKEIPVERVSRQCAIPHHEFSRIDEKTVMLRLDDFMDGDAIQALYEAHDREICASENLIIDVRNNGGGMDTLFYPLIKYCFPKGVYPKEEAYGQEINFSDRNVELRLAILAEFGQQELPEETRAILDKMQETLKENKGRGFVDDPGGDEEITEKGAGGYPKNVYILSDCYCASSGDAFVEMMRESPKVTVVGRPTMGILDYSNEAQCTYGEYRFMYPTSRRKALDHGIVMNGNGVPVDVYVPWTPEHLERDVDMETVQALIKER